MMKSALKWYVLSNLHIAICAVTFLIGGSRYFDRSIDIPLVSFIGIGTWVIYLLHRWIGSFKHENFRNAERFWIHSIPNTYIKTVILIFGCLLFINGLQLIEGYFFPLILIGLASGLYVLPLFKKARLRDIGYLKIFLVALVWASVFTLPLGNEIFIGQANWKFGLAWLEKFIFIFALTLPFDIRDKELDEDIQVSTLANVLSPQTIRKLILLLIISAILIVAIEYRFGYYSSFLAGGLSLLYVVQWLVSKDTSSRTPELYFLGALDSFILLQGMVHWWAH